MAHEETITRISTDFLLRDVVQYRMLETMSNENQCLPSIARIKNPLNGSNK